MGEEKTGTTLVVLTSNSVNRKMFTTQDVPFPPSRFFAREEEEEIEDMGMYSSRAREESDTEECM